MKKIKIRVGLPFYKRFIHAKTQSMLSKLEQYSGDDIEFDVVRVPDCTISQGRNLALLKGLYNHKPVFDFDYFFSVDSDVYTPFETIKKLVERDKPIVFSAYKPKFFFKRHDLFCCGFWGEQKGYIPEEKFIGDNCKGFLKVDWCGMGATLIHVDVFKKLKFPFWDMPYKKYKEGIFQLGDDVFFCMKAGEKKIPICADCENKSEHIF